MLGIGLYQLHMSENGDTICGSFRGGAGCDADFFLHRNDDVEFAAEWRRRRKEDIANCKHPMANEVRLGNQ